MKLLLLALLLVTYCTAFPTFEEYVLKFNKDYNDLEYEQRRELYNYHISTLEKHSSDNYNVGINKFSDMTVQEKSMFLGIFSHNHQKFSGLPSATAPTPKGKYKDSIDWSEEGATTPVKDQGQCGSCWAFASTEGVESAWYLATGELLELAPQQFVDCVVNTDQCGGTGGCEGATVEVAYDYLLSSEGLTLEKEYPYQAKDGTCESHQAYANITNYKVSKVNDYDSVMTLLQSGPTLISVDAGSWFSYSSGIFDGCNQDQPDINHAVQLVGYGEEDGKAYWKVRNSWGSTWAEGGYIRLKRHTNNDAPCGMDITPQDGTACQGETDPVEVCGTCGILFDTVLPVV